MYRKVLILAAFACGVYGADDCFTGGRGTSCDSLVQGMEEDAKQALDSTMNSCLKEVKSDNNDMDAVKEAVCRSPIMKRKFLECFKNDIGGALLENTIFNHQNRAKGKEVVKCYEEALK